MEPDRIKRCCVCDADKPWTIQFFSANRRRADGIGQPCRKCARKRKADYKKTDKGLISEQRYRGREETKRYMRSYRKTRTPSEATKNWVAEYATSDRKREAQKRWRDANPDAQAVAQHRRRARIRGLDNTFTATEWTTCLIFFGNRCVACGQDRCLQQDHWVPAASGGPYTKGNIVPLCGGRGGCNKSKNSTPAMDWLVGKRGSAVAACVIAKVNAYFESVI